MDRTQFLRRYWSYYTKLEQDCMMLSRYIDFRDSNFSTCSDEIIGQLLNVGAEFDFFCKIVCSIDPGKRANIQDYAAYLIRNIGNLLQVTVHIQGTSIDLHPFDAWNMTAPSDLFWWSAYNNVKHNREGHYEEGNLKNLLNALAALYFLEMYFVRDIAQKTGDDHSLDVPMNTSQLFRIVGWKTKFSIIGYNHYTDYEEGMDNIF